jgi:hypothetical protein
MNADVYTVLQSNVVLIRDVYFPAYTLAQLVFLCCTLW